tara:strand:+ start:348 stop:965 length:618 start_codon:yes stop_codon:yes gene_type:complete
VVKRNIIKIFPQTLMLTKYEDDLSEELRYVQSLEYTGLEDNGNFQSKDTYLLRRPELAKLKKFVNDTLDYFTTQILQSTQQIRTTQAWVTKNPPGSFHHPHIHENSIYSCCFYFTQNKDHPPIGYFDRNRNILQLHYEKINLLNAQSFYLPCTAGEMVVFPSNLWHKVPVNKGKGDRLSLSMNTFTTNELGSIGSLTHLNVNDLH